jgi:hypothetical protein
LEAVRFFLGLLVLVLRCISASTGRLELLGEGSHAGFEGLDVFVLSGCLHFVPEGSISCSLLLLLLWEGLADGLGHRFACCRSFFVGLLGLKHCWVAVTQELGKLLGFLLGGGLFFVGGL